MKTKLVKRTELQPGNIVHAYGARFEITTMQILVTVSSARDHQQGLVTSPFIMLAESKWLDGKIVDGYFGPTRSWKFQGNDGALVDIEV